MAVRAAVRSGGFWASCCVLVACVAAPARVALQGDLPSLQQAIDQAEHQGQLGRGNVRELASAVVERELGSLREPIEHFPDLAACAKSVHGSLRELAVGSGEAAALAEIQLLDSGLDAPTSELSEEPARSMVAARRAVGVRAGAARRAFLLHGDAGVRRAALEAAVQSRDGADVPALLEAARLDPDAQNRALSTRALGEVGGPRAVVGLSDLWSTASSQERRDIIDAWSAPASFAAGGERELVRSAELGSGSLAVRAALSLLERRAGPEGLAESVLRRAMQGRDSAARLLALYEVPWSNPELRGAVVQAQRAEDAPTRLIAWLRAAEAGELGPDGVRELGTLAADRTLPTGNLARAALAQHGDVQVKEGLRADLQAPHARYRMLAAFSLLSIGEWPSAARALGDDSPEVRQTVACQVLRDPGQAAGGERSEKRAQAYGPLASELPHLLVSADAAD